MASVTTSIIEVGDWKFWIIFHQREKNIELDSDQIIERIFVFTCLPCIFGYHFFFLLWPLKFEFGHQIFEVGGQLPTKIKIPLWGQWHAFVTYTWERIYLISNIKILSYFRSTLSIGPQRKVNLRIMAPLRWPYRVSRRNSCGQRG